MPRTTGIFRTESGSKYLQQLCKHFGHKLPSEFTPEKGYIEFGFGRVNLTADSRALNVQIDLVDDTPPGTAQNVIDRHLERFAFREEFKAMDWTVAA